MPVKDEFSIAMLDVTEKQVLELTDRNKTKEPQKTNNVITTVSFPIATLDELKVLAIKRRTNVRSLLREAADDLLQKYKT